MAKKRKTRQQKIVSSTRPQLETPVNTFSYSLPPSHSQSSPRPAAIAINTNDYSFVRKDLIHTASVIGAIILAELVLFFLLRSI